MGNNLSQLNNNTTKDDKLNNTNLIETIDMIACNYILKQNMIDILRFTDKDYYDNLIILTSTIMKNNLSSVDIGIMKDRIFNGYNNENINKNTNNSSNNIYFSNKEELREITLNNENQKKKALLHICKFYIKILSIFSAITAIIDPQYVYEDKNGEKKYFYLKDFNDYTMIDKTTKNLKINQLDNPINFVQKRLTILKNRLDSGSDLYEDKDNIIINPGQLFCEKNQDENSLIHDVGIKELEILYYDIYDTENNKWSSRSDEMDVIYKKDLLNLYQIFTGKKVLPENIKSFKDIENLEFSTIYRCKNKDYVKDLVVLKTDKMYKNYMKKIEEIQKITVLYKKKLLYILKSIFKITPDNNDTNYILNPELNMKTIINLQKETKNSIFNIYIGCQQKYMEALLLYEKMYENQYGILNDNQIKQLNKEINNNNDKNYNKTINQIINTESLNISPLETDNNIELNSNLLKNNNDELSPNKTTVLNRENLLNANNYEPVSSILSPNNDEINVSPTVEIPKPYVSPLPPPPAIPSIQLPPPPSIVPSTPLPPPPSIVPSTPLPPPPSIVPSTPLPPSSPAVPSTSLPPSSPAVPSTSLPPSSPAVPSTSLPPSSPAVPSTSLPPSSPAVPSTSLPQLVPVSPVVQPPELKTDAPTQSLQQPTSKVPPITLTNKTESPEFVNNEPLNDKKITLKNINNKSIKPDKKNNGLNYLFSLFSGKEEEKKENDEKKIITQNPNNDEKEENARNRINLDNNGNNELTKNIEIEKNNELTENARNKINLDNNGNNELTKNIEIEKNNELTENARNKINLNNNGNNELTENARNKINLDNNGNNKLTENVDMGENNKVIENVDMGENIEMGENNESVITNNQNNSVRTER